MLYYKWSKFTTIHKENIDIKDIFLPVNNNDLIEMKNGANLDIN